MCWFFCLIHMMYNTMFSFLVHFSISHMTGSASYTGITSCHFTFTISATLQFGIQSFLALSKGIFSVFLVSFIFSFSRSLDINPSKIMLIKTNHIYFKFVISVNVNN